MIIPIISRKFNFETLCALLRKQQFPAVQQSLVGLGKMRARVHAPAPDRMIYGGQPGAEATPGPRRAALEDGQSFLTNLAVTDPASEWVENAVGWFRYR